MLFGNSFGHAEGVQPQRMAESSLRLWTKQEAKAQWVWKPPKDPLTHKTAVLQQSCYGPATVQRTRLAIASNPQQKISTEQWFSATTG